MSSALVGIVMGSESDLDLMRPAIEALAEFDIGAEVRVLSAHRTPHVAAEWAATAAERGLRVIIAAAGHAAHLAGVVAAHTALPVVGIPIGSSSLNGLDALLATVQMPSGIPVATMAINGSRNAALYAVRILATSDESLRHRYEEFMASMSEKVLAADERVRQLFG